MLDLVFDSVATTGGYAVRGRDDNIVAVIDRHWTRTSFVASTPDRRILCRVDRGGLLDVTWTAVTADDQPLLVFSSNGKISFADGRSARLTRPFLRRRWSIVDHHDILLATGVFIGPRLFFEVNELAVQVDEQRLSPAELVAVAEAYRLDHSRRNRSVGGVIGGAIRRV